MFTKSRGFTLIEILAALAIFSIVAVIAAGATVAINSVSQKSQAIKLALDNLNFALESMALNLASGSQYTCGSGSSPSTVSSTGSSGLNCSFISFNRHFLDESTRPSPRAYGLISPSGGSGHIEYWRDGAFDLPGSPITSDKEINVQTLRFNVYNDGNCGGICSNKTFVLIEATGVAGGGRYVTPFALRTAVASRGLGFVL